MDIKAFFRRIGLPEGTPVSASYEFLRDVQYNAVLKIAYENLEILEGKPLALDADSLFDKIVTRGMGGYCFEVNGLLSRFFKDCGLEVTDYFARYLRGEPEIPMRRHRVMSVRTPEGSYFCDIGVGQSAPRYPLLMKEGFVQEQFGETYRFGRDPDLGWVLYDLHKGKWREFISFTEDRVYEVDFIQPSVFCELHPSSPFNKVPMIAIKTPDGRKTIDDRLYKVFEGDRVVYSEDGISSDRYHDLLREEFYLNV
ncbi:MAG: arylamine N-acetyltransferase [Clostridia bacterium]|nr:arylamine N-acetyltransferase [Clostridia bacterium]